MSTGYSKTLLRKGALKPHGGHPGHRHAHKGKGGATGEEEAILFAPVKHGARPPHGAKMRAE